MTPGLPRLVWVPAFIGFALIAVPIVGLVARVPFGRLGDLLGSDAAVDALELSLRTGAIATLLCLVCL